MRKSKTIIYLGVSVIATAIALTFVSLMQRESSIVVPAEEVHKMISAGDCFIAPADLEKFDHELSDGYLLIDLRSPDEFQGDHLKNAVNIPYQEILNEEHAPVFRDGRKKILLASSESKAAEVWTLLAQTGVREVYVLKGGLPYWQEKMEGRNVFGKSAIDEEKARYDFKKELTGTAKDMPSN